MKRIARPDRIQTGGILTKLLLWLMILFGIGAVAWILLLPRLVVSQVHAKTGFTVTIDHLSVNPFTANVLIQGMVLKNPEGWPVQDFLTLREFKADAELSSLFSSRLVVNEVVLDIARCTMVKNQHGALNATAFSNAINGSDGNAAKGEPKSKDKPKEFLIKHLALKFDTLVYVDHSITKPTTKEYNLNLNQDLRDVDSVAKIVNPIATASIGVLADAFSGAVNGRTNLLKDAAGAIQGAGKKAGEKLKGLLDSLDKKKP
jgi:uncharacterized protein involved in outer membrane biogenesis